MDSNSEHKKNYGYYGGATLGRKNQERVNSLVNDYAKEFNEYGLTSDDFKLIDRYDGFYSKLKELL